MDDVKAYIITVIACVLVASLVLAIAPEGSIRKHLRFLLGVIFTVVMLSPLANGAFDNISLPEPVFGAPGAAVSQETLKKLMNEQSMELYVSKLKSTIANAAGLKEEKISVKLKADGNIEQIILKGAEPYNADKASARLGINREYFSIER